MRKAMLLLTLWVCVLPAQEALFPTNAVPGKNLWRASLSTLAVANALDMQSSWGKHELNPALASPAATFGRQGALIKLGLQGGLAGIEYLLTRGHPSGKLYRCLAVVNFSASAGMAAVAVHNYTVPGAPR
jgi:hypothetical protein